MRIPSSLFASYTNKVHEYAFCERTDYKMLQSELQYKILHCSFLAWLNYVYIFTLQQLSMAEE